MTWILRLIFLVVLLSMLYAILPESRLKGIWSIIAGIILLLNLIQPIGRFVQGNPWMNFGDFFMDGTIDNSADNQNQILLRYKEQCVQTIVAHVTAIDTVADCRGEVLVDENWGTDTFGSIQHVYLYVSLGEKKKNESWIPPVVIFPQTESNQKEHQEQLKAIQSSVSSWLQIDLNCVTVFEEV